MPNEHVNAQQMLKQGLVVLQSEVAVMQSSPGAAASAPADGLPPGVSVTVSVTPTDSSAATPLIATASPSPARRLLADAVTTTGTGVDVNITITAPASDMNNITALVTAAVTSGQVQQQLQQAGECPAILKGLHAAILPGTAGLSEVTCDFRFRMLGITVYMFMHASRFITACLSMPDNAAT